MGAIHVSSLSKHYWYTQLKFEFNIKLKKLDMSTCIISGYVQKRIKKKQVTVLNFDSRRVQMRFKIGLKFQKSVKIRVKIGQNSH